MQIQANDFPSKVPLRTYSFQEVTSECGIKPYVLRFWESEFDEIDPTLDALNGQKVFSEHDVQIVKKIKELLFKQKMTVIQVKGYLQVNSLDEQASSPEVEEVEELTDTEAPQLIFDAPEQEKVALFEPVSLAETNEEESMYNRSNSLKESLLAKIKDGQFESSSENTQDIDESDELVSQETTASLIKEESRELHSVSSQGQLNDQKLKSSLEANGAKDILYSVINKSDKNRLSHYQLVKVHQAKKRLTLMRESIDRQLSLF